MEEWLIGICDDMRAVYESFSRYMEEYAKEKGISCRIIWYDSGEKLLEAEERFDLDVLFLDIEMPGGADGIETAERLRRQGEIEYKIIMLTGMPERFKEAFKIGAFRFVTKPIRTSELYEAMDAVRMRRIGEDTVTVYFEGQQVEIPQKKIDYMVPAKTSVYLYAGTYEYRSDLSLKKWEEILDKRLFFRCHKTFIVNFRAISKVEKNVITLYNGDKVAISYRKRAEFMKAFMEYDIYYE